VEYLEWLRKGRLSLESNNKFKMVQKRLLLKLHNENVRQRKYNEVEELLNMYGKLN